MKLKALVIAAALAAIASMAQPALAAEKCTIAWSHYTGWEPLDYMQSKGVLQKWGKKYGVELDITPPMDYIESINQFTAKSFCAVAVTNMDALTIPAASGVDVSFIVVGDYSNGNDGLIVKSGKPVAIKDLVGREVKLVENSVSHYLLARALGMHNLPLSKVRVVNTTDSDIGSVFAASGDGIAAVTWNPILMTSRNVKGAQLLFDSSRIPGEIIDGIVVHTGLSDNIKKAIVGAWFETMSVMATAGTPAYRDAIAIMAKSAGGSEGEFLSQLKTTFLFYKPSDAVSFTEDSQLKGTMDFVRKFSFEVGLFEGAKSSDHVGIQFPDGTTLGNPQNVKLRFDTKYMRMAAEGKL